MIDKRNRYLYLHSTIGPSGHWPREEQREAVVEWLKANGLDGHCIADSPGIAIRSPLPDSLQDAVLMFEEYRLPMDGTRIERSVPMTVPLPDPPTFPIHRHLPKQPCPTCGQEVPA